MEYLLAFQAALALAEKLAPLIQQKVQSGEITAEQQLEARNRYLALRAKGDEAFTGPEWEPSDTPGASEA